MAQMVQQCQNVYTAMGARKGVLPAEMEQRAKMRRSVIATRDLPAGTVLKKDDLSAKRPGTGIPVEKIGELVGKVLIRDVKADTLILDADLS